MIGSVLFCFFVFLDIGSLLKAHVLKCIHGKREFRALVFHFLNISDKFGKTVQTHFNRHCHQCGLIDSPHQTPVQLYPDDCYTSHFFAGFLFAWLCFCTKTFCTIGKICHSSPCSM